MNKLPTLFIILLPLIVAACGGSGDTESIKQIVEQNKFNITALVLKSKLTQTLNPVNANGAIPTFYFSDANNAEQIIATGINDSGEEIALNNIRFELIDTVNATDATSISEFGKLQLEDLGANLTKEITVQANFGTVSSTAKIIISSHPLQAGGLSLLIGSKLVNSTTQAVTVCAETAFDATGTFADGSKRTITHKVDWASSISDSNTQFDVSDSNRPLFWAHTNALYTLNVAHDSQTASVDLDVTQAGFSNMLITPTTITLKKSATKLLTLTATINSLQLDKLEYKANWVSQNVSIVSVNTGNGEVTAKLIGGPIAITASCGTSNQVSSITVE